MEALLLIFGQIIFVAMAPVFAVAGALFGVMLELVVAVFGGLIALLVEIFGGRRKTAATPAEPRAPRKPLIPRKVLHWTAGMLGGLGVVALVASVLFLQPILNYGITTAAAKKGFDVSFEKASGLLVTGNVELRGVRVVRDAADGLQLDVRAERAKADVDMWSLLGKEPVLALGDVEGVTGFVSPPERDKEKPEKERRPFRVDLLRVSDVALEVRPKGSAAYPLEIETAQVAPFRSKIALFDLLFRSTLKAEIAGQPLSVETRRITEDGRETVWSFENVEADKVRLLVPKAPVTWLNGGVLNVRVEDRWSLSDDFIDMDWRLGFADVEVRVPEGAKATEKLLGGAFAKLVNAQGGDADLRYRLQIADGEMEALRSGDLEQFWDTVMSGFVSSGGAGLSVGSQEDGAPGEDKPGAMDRLKGLFNRDE